MIDSAVKRLQIGVLLTFVGINLRFVSENVFNALIFFNILQSEDPKNRYDIHAPSVPDMCGDTAMVVTFTAAYLFNRSASESIVLHIMDYLYEKRSQRLETVRHLKNCIIWSKRFFFLTLTGFGFYMVSKYVLSIGLEVFFIGNNAEPAFVLKVLHGIMLLCSSLIFVNVYSKYLFIRKPVVLMMYAFFLIRNLFNTNVYSLITSYDLHVGAPFLDIFSPIIVIYSVVSLISKDGRQNRIFHISLSRDKHEPLPAAKRSFPSAEDHSLILK